MCIRQANLDAMCGRAVLTIEGHTAAIKRAVRNSRAIRKTPTIPPRGPMPLTDNSGMAIAVDMLYNSLSGETLYNRGKVHTIRLDASRESHFHIGVGIFTCRHRGGFDLHLRRDEDHCYNLPHTTEVVWFVPEGFGKLHGLLLPT